MNKTLVAFDGDPMGLLSFLNAKPLAIDDLNPVPADASFALVARIDATQIYREFVAMMETIDPNFVTSFKQEVQQATKELGIDPVEELLLPLGDTLRLFSSPGEGGLLPSGLMGIVTVRDPKRLSAALENLATSDAMRRETDGLAISEYQGQQIYTIRMHHALAPSWCFRNDELLVALFPQTLRAHLARPADAARLSGLAPIAQPFAQLRKPRAIAYVNTPELFPWVYTALQLGAPTAAHELRKQQIAMEVSVLPASSAITRHLSPSVFMLSKEPAGLLLIGRTHMQGTDPPPKQEE